MENAATAAHAARSLLLTVARHCRNRCPRRREPMAACEPTPATYATAPAGRSGTTSADGAAFGIDEELDAGVVLQLAATRTRRMPAAQLPSCDDQRVEDQVERQRADEPVQEHVEPGEHARE